MEKAQLKYFHMEIKQAHSVPPRRPPVIRAPSGHAARYDLPTRWQPSAGAE